MILSIRHRIFLPFLFITIFMAFSSLYIGIELIQNYFNHQIYQTAFRNYVPIEQTLSQIAAQSILSPNRSSPPTLAEINHWLSTQPMHWVTISQKKLMVNTKEMPDLVPFQLQSTTFSPNLSALYIQHEGIYHRVYHSLNRSTEVDSKIDASSRASILDTGFFDQKIGTEWFRSYFFTHPSIVHLLVELTIPCTDLFKKKKVILIASILTICLINAFIVLIFSIILKRITLSLSKITDSANQLSKGLRTSPLSVNSNDEIGLLAQSFNHMLNNVQTKTAELIYERNRSKMILAQLPEGIIVTDLNNKLLSANRAAELMLGFSTDRARGQELISYLKNENLSSFFNHELPYVKDSALVRELIIPNAHGNDDHYQITVSPLLDTTYQKTGMITVIRNITEEKKSRLLKDHFLRSITHELRIPLTSIIGFLNILVKESHGSLNDSQREFLSIATINANSLKKLINDLLELSIIHSGQIKLSYKECRLKPIIDEIINDIDPIIQKKSNQISVSFQDPNMSLVADQEKLTLVLKNLILNANKATQNGHIECLFHQTSSYSNFIVKDDGVGLTDQTKRQLLDAFKPLNGRSFAYDGLGLELTLVKELVYLQDGQIFIESSLDEGSTFTITLPQSPTNTMHSEWVESTPPY